jgi:hypothetical protein
MEANVHLVYQAWLKRTVIPTTENKTIFVWVVVSSLS